MITVFFSLLFWLRLKLLLGRCFFSLRDLDKQKIENETKKQTQRDSTIEVLEEQLQLWTAKVSGNIYISYSIVPSAIGALCNYLRNKTFHFIRYFFGLWQAEQAQQIYIENEKRLEEMLDGIEKLFGWVNFMWNFFN